MNPLELKMQPTIYFERKAWYGHGKYPALPSKCIVGCIFNFIGLIVCRVFIVFIYRATPAALH
jgi:hypothetical protein